MEKETEINEKIIANEDCYPSFCPHCKLNLDLHGEIDDDPFGEKLKEACN